MPHEARDYHGSKTTTDERLAWLDGWAEARIGLKRPQRTPNPKPFLPAGEEPTQKLLLFARGVARALYDGAYEAGKAEAGTGD